MSELQVNTEELEYCKIKVNYTADSDVVGVKYKEAIKQLRKMPVPGFRPGKATDLAIKLKYKDRIKDWVIREMLQQAHDDILFETKMRPLGNYQVQTVKLDKNDFNCELVYLKKPEFELAKYAGLEVPTPHIDEMPEQIAERLLQDLREQHGETRPYEENEFVQPGDQITMDYEVAGEKQVGMVYHVGSNVVPGLDDSIVGMTPGEDRSFPLEVDGEKKDAKVILHMGTKKIPCPLSAELAQKVGFKTVEELHQKAQVTGEEQLRSRKNVAIAEQIKKQLVAAHDFEVPPWLLGMEAQQIAAQEGVNWDGLSEAAKQPFIDRGKDQVKFALILDSVRLAEADLQLSDDEAVRLVGQRVASMGVPDPDKFISESARNGRLHGLMASLRNDYTMQWLVDKATVVE
jgi:trigger factor